MEEPTKYLDIINQLLDGKIEPPRDEIQASQTIVHRLKIATALGEDFFGGNIEATIAIFHQINEEARVLKDKIDE